MDDLELEPPDYALLVILIVSLALSYLSPLFAALHSYTWVGIWWLSFAVFAVAIGVAAVWRWRAIKLWALFAVAMLPNYSPMTVSLSCMLGLDCAMP